MKFGNTKIKKYLKRRQTLASIICQVHPTMSIDLFSFSNNTNDNLKGWHCFKSGHRTIYRTKRISSMYILISYCFFCLCIDFGFYYIYDMLSLIFCCFFCRKPIGSFNVLILIAIKIENDQHLKTNWKINKTQFLNIKIISIRIGSIESTAQNTTQAIKSEIKHTHTILISNWNQRKYILTSYTEINF